jgi:hypothetical protein
VLTKAGLRPERRAHHDGADVELWATEAPPAGA